jgi:GAF domain-containing protein
MACDASVVLSALQAKATETLDADVLGKTLVTSLKENLPKADWVGIYWLRGPQLHLGPYVGPETEHTVIPVGRGVCGTAIAEERDQIVEDVTKVENYLACSASTRSEIVVLIRSMGHVVGQIDIDSNEPSAFGAVEHCILRAVADAFGGLLSLSSSGRLHLGS